MSWAEEDWTVGLSGRVLQKVKELQVHQERLSRENKQKQLQLDNIHTSLEKQTGKYEEVRGELQHVQRELQRVQEEAKAAVTSSKRLTQELQTKQAQVCSLEGQVDAARTSNNKLTQDVKRLEAELEKLQNSSRLADTTLFSTPSWNTTSPWEHRVGSRKEERLGHRDEGQSRALHSRRLEFSEGGSASSPQQHKNTPQRHSSDQSDTFSTPLAAFPWERDDSRPAARRQSPISPQTPCADVISQGQSKSRLYGKETDHRTETDACLSEVWSRVAALEEELCAKARTLKSIQSEMVQSKKELGARELSLQKARDELSQAHARTALESERVSAAEQKLKQLQEELKCQRQNAESSRLQHQQRSKELEKQHQRDLTELQKERQTLEKQHQQEVNKLNQELQQARTLHNALQAQADKLSLQKQALDKELDTLKEKLKWTEGQLQESQKKETQTQAKLTEALREAEGVAVSLEQSRKRERALEEEGRRLAEERADALRLLKELQEQKAVPAPPLQPVQFCPVGQSFSPQPSYSPHSRPSTHIKTPNATTLAEQKRDEDMDVDKRRAEIAEFYPSDREPGEGIDSEHITDLTSPDSEFLLRGGHEEDNKSRNEAIEGDSSGTNKHSTFDQILSSSSHSAAVPPTNTSVDGDHCRFSSLEASEDLKRENATLRSDLHDAREELQKRLEDLEAQRRAETEARTRLKQLSRKRASQAVEKDEQGKEWRAQLESERAETERLRKVIAALETEMKRGSEERERKEREEQEEERNKALEDRESETMDLNIKLKKKLAEMKARLAVEREEREREEEERNQITNVKEDLSMKMELLKAELEELKCSREEDSSGEEKLSVANSPLTYLTLHDDELNSNIVCFDNRLPSSPEQHLLFCQSTNQRNMLVSQATADLIQEERTVIVIDPERSPLSNEGHTGGEASDLEDYRQNSLLGSSLSLSDLQNVEPASSDLTKEVEHLQKENTKETERANQYQVKLEALQNQVTRQTKQLTIAFEKQSQHISGLLAELQEKERALLSQGEELQRYKQELAATRAEKEGEEEMMVKEVEDGEQKVETQEEVTVKEVEDGEQKEETQEEMTVKEVEDGEQKEETQEEMTVKEMEDGEQKEETQEKMTVKEVEDGEQKEETQEEMIVKEVEDGEQKEETQEEMIVKEVEDGEQKEETQEEMTVKEVEDGEQKEETQEEMIVKEVEDGEQKEETQEEMTVKEVEDGEQKEETQEEMIVKEVEDGEQKEETQEEMIVKEVMDGEQKEETPEEMTVKEVEDGEQKEETQEEMTVKEMEDGEQKEETQEEMIVKEVEDGEQKEETQEEMTVKEVEDGEQKEETQEEMIVKEVEDGEQKEETQEEMIVKEVEDGEQKEETQEEMIVKEVEDGEQKEETQEEMTVKEVEDGEQKEETQDERPVEISGLQSNQKNECAVTILTTNSLAEGDSHVQRDAGQLNVVTSDAIRPTAIIDKSDNEALRLGGQHLSSQVKTQSNHDSACVISEMECSQDGGMADVENQLLKQRIEGLTVSDARTPALHTDSENQGDPIKQSQNTGNAALSCFAELRSPSLLNDVTTDARQSLLQDVKRREDEGGDLEKEDGKTTRTEEELDLVSELHVNRLQQQVEELQMRLQALSAENQQQAEELVMWRLASQPAPTFDQFLPNTDNQSETQDQISAVRQSQSNQQESPCNVTVVREDELFLSCFSNKLQGRMLFSRLQHSNLPEPKSVHPSKKTAALQEYNQTVQESEKENHEISLLPQSNTCQTQHKEKRDTVIQISSEKTGQPHATKESHKVSRPKQTRSADCYTGNPEVTPEASRATNEINTTNDPSDRDLRTEMKSVSSQTEESLYPCSARLTSELRCAYTQTEEEKEELVESPPVSSVLLPEGAELGDRVLFSGSFPIPADPARLAERIRRNRTQLSAAFDDTEYEPYGLPEVVMKGFADIPSGPSCPYIVRRGLLGTTAVPVPQKDTKQEEETD